MRRLWRMARAVRTITELVRERVRREGIDLLLNPSAATRYIRDEVIRDQERDGGVDPAALERAVLAELTGFGALQPLLDDPEVEEIWINGPARVFAARGGVAQLTTIVMTDDEVRDIVERMLASSGRRVDHSQPAF